MQQKNQSVPFHSITYLYDSLKRIFIIVVIGLIVKFCLFDIRGIDGSQMSPSIVKGDKFAIFRLTSLPGIRNIIKPKRGQTVLFEMPFTPKNKGCLRVAGVSSDTVWIDSGIFYNPKLKPAQLKNSHTTEEIVPWDYSPRDFFTPYRVPAPKDTFNLDSRNLREFFLAVSVIRQENPDSSFSLKPELILDDSIANDYFINEFSLYNGLLDSIPQQYRYDWFFWTRLKEYLSMVHYNQNVELKFTFNINDKSVSKYIVKSSYIFLLADNWKTGLDSRFFGPIKTTFVEGKAFMVLWSYDSKPEDHKKLKLNRIGRIIK